MIKTCLAASAFASFALTAHGQFASLSIVTEGTFADPPDPSDADVAEVLGFTGPLTQLDLAGVPDGTFLSDEFADLGVRWTDPDSLLETDFFFPDQVTVDGNGSTDGDQESVIAFDLPQTAFAVQFSGDIAVQLFRDGVAISDLVEIQETSEFPTIIRSIAGIVSDEPFDEIVLSRNSPFGSPAFYQEIFVQNLVPSPSAAVMLGLGIAGGLSRRRR
ncbi:MAG: hypothetical protein AAGF47_06180 [Planctomycetota bacterium]